MHSIFVLLLAIALQPSVWGYSIPTAGGNLRQESTPLEPRWERPSGPGIVFSPDGSRIAVAGRYLPSDPGSTVLVLDALSGAVLRKVEHKDNLDVFNFGFSPDGSRLFTSSQRDGSVLTWEVSTGRQIDRLKVLSPSAREVEGYATKSVLSPNGEYVAVVHNRGDRWYDREWATISVWDVARRKKVRELKEGKHSVELMVFSPDGDELFVQQRGGNARVWDLRSGLVLKDFGKHLADTLHVAFSSTGHKIVGRAIGRGATVYDTSTGAAVTTFEDVPGPLAFAFGDGDRLLAIGGWGEIQVRDLTTGMILATFGGQDPRQKVTGIAFSPDGKLLAGHFRNRGVVVWAVPQH
jgi:WD40 repeat protein